jgi:hypothetical protein
MATPPRALTADEVFALPAPDDSLGFECVDGRPVPVMAATPIHGKLNGEVYRRLANHVIDNKLPGKCYIDAGFVLGLRRDRERMRGPDVSFVSRDKVDAHPGWRISALPA